MHRTSNSGQGTSETEFPEASGSLVRENGGKTVVKNKNQPRGKFCCVPECMTREGSFYKFPDAIEDGERRAEWIRTLQIEGIVGKNKKVCAKHFRDEDYYNEKRFPCQVYLLKKTAVPTRNLPPLRTVTIIDGPIIDNGMPERRFDRVADFDVTDIVMF